MWLSKICEKKIRKIVFVNFLYNFITYASNVKKLYKNLKVPIRNRIFYKKTLNYIKLIKVKKLKIKIIQQSRNSATHYINANNLWFFKTKKKKFKVFSIYEKFSTAAWFMLRKNNEAERGWF